MKLNLLKIFVILSLSLIFGCSSDEAQKPEVRFVDLQGNARSIKTRVPEANAKIMSGQPYNYNAQQNNPEIQNEYLENKKNSVGIASPNDKELIVQKNNFTPKFTDSDTYIKNSPITKSRVETENQNVVENNEPVVEYDLSNEDDSNNKIANKKTLSQKDYSSLENESSITTKSSSVNKNNLNQNEYSDLENESSIIKKRKSTDKINLNQNEYSDIENNSLITKKRKGINKINLNQNENVEYIDEDIDESKSKKLVKKSSKFITYSNKKTVPKPQKTITLVEDESEEVQTQYIGKSGGGRVYVQVGSFFNSTGAKQRLIKTKAFGKGKVLVGYNKQNKRVYRSVYGPFKSKNSALTFRDKVIDSGNEAIIIHGK